MRSVGCFVIRTTPAAYNGFVITRDVHSFIRRDWAAARAAKDAYWAERIARLGALEAFRIAEELRRQVLDRNPSWPDDGLRAEDLRSHVRLAERFARSRATGSR